MAARQAGHSARVQDVPATGDARLPLARLLGWHLLSSGPGANHGRKVPTWATEPASVSQNGSLVVPWDWFLERGSVCHGRQASLRSLCAHFQGWRVRGASSASLCHPLIPSGPQGAAHPVLAFPHSPPPLGGKPCRSPRESCPTAAHTGRVCGQLHLSPRSTSCACCRVPG